MVVRSLERLFSHSSSRVLISSMVRYAISDSLILNSRTFSRRSGAVHSSNPRTTLNISLKYASFKLTVRGVSRAEPRQLARPLGFPCRWRVTIQACSSFRLKERWLKWVSMVAGQRSRLCARPYRRVPACRPSNLESSFSSSVKRFPSASRRRETGSGKTIRPFAKRP